MPINDGDRHAATNVDLRASVGVAPACTAAAWCCVRIEVACAARGSEGVIAITSETNSAIAASGCALDHCFAPGWLAFGFASIVAGLPSDGYGRGATEPVLPNQPTLFYRAGLENICSLLSAKVIDAPTNSKWSSTQPDAAIADMVATMLALTPSDPRAAQAQSLLTAHFHSAMSSGASASDALKSTFVVSCLSPTFSGIGM